MKIHGILFKGQMIEALLNTQIDTWPAQAIEPAKPSKWQTRREIDPQPPNGLNYVECFRDGVSFGKSIDQPAIEQYGCPHPVGTILYAKETWRTRIEWDKLKPTELPIPELEKQENYDWCQDEYISYAVSDKVLHQFRGKTRTAMFMRPWMSRLWFEVMQVRVHRVNTISDKDAQAEGVQGVFYHSGDEIVPHTSGPYRKAYERLFDEINGPLSFRNGTWVFAYDLKRITRPKL